MKLVYLLLSDFEYIGLLLMMLSLISDVKITRDIRQWIGVSTFMVVVVVGSAYIYDVNIIFFLFLMLLVVVIGVCIENFKWGMLIDVVLSVILISISTQLLKMIVFVALAWGGITISDDWASVVAQLVLLLIVIALYRHIQAQHPAELKSIPMKYLAIFMVVLAADCISLTYWGEYILENPQNNDMRLCLATYVLMGIGVFVQLGLLIALYFSRNAYRTQQAMAKRYLEEQVAHYQYLSEREQNTRRFRHDFKSHMAMAKQLYLDGKQEEFETYFREMTERIATFGNRVTVNNDLADAIINRYYDEAEQNGIMMEVEGHFPGVCYISAYDLCTVLSNLLGNAIDAEKEAGGKTIYCGVRYDETQIFIVVKNDYINTIKQTDNRFLSTKGGLRHQGFGIVNVNEVVRKNKGHVVYDAKNSRFVVRLSLCNMEQSS